MENSLILGDCVEKLRDFPENSIDLIVTDPPYGLSFMGKEWDKVLPPKESFLEMLRVLKPGAIAFVMSSPRQDVLWRMLAMLEGAGFELQQSFVSWVYASGFPKAYDVSKGIDKKLGIISNGEETKKGVSKPSQVFEYGFKPIFKEIKATSDDAKAWSGWKSITGLKPALECILMVNKPMSEKTIVDNVLKWGTGAMNVDACRIPFKSDQDYGEATRPNCDGKIYDEPLEHVFGKGISGLKGSTQPEGRFPANLLVSDDALNDGKEHSSCKSTKIHDEYGNGFKFGGGLSTPENQYNDYGSFSRYFDLDAWAKHHGFLNVPKADTGERDDGLSSEDFEEERIPTAGLEGLIQSGKEKPRNKRRNIHPTVKPIKLMAYLIELGCPSRGIVLDPFMGSGTTCIAAKLLERKYIGIEIDPEYFKIAEERINHATLDILDDEMKEIIFEKKVKIKSLSEF